MHTGPTLVHPEPWGWIPGDQPSETCKSSSSWRGAALVLGRWLLERCICRLLGWRGALILVTRRRWLLLPSLASPACRGLRRKPVTNSKTRKCGSNLPAKPPQTLSSCQGQVMRGIRADPGASNGDYLRRVTKAARACRPLRSFCSCTV